VIAVSVGLVCSYVPSASAEFTFLPSYELVGADGGVFTVGGATYMGSLGGQRIAHPIVAVLNAVPGLASGPGYLLIDSAGIVYPFGLSSLGDLRHVHLNAPIVAAFEADHGSARGYVMVARDGGVFTFGTAVYSGSLAPFHLRSPIVASAQGDVAGEYWLVDAAGHVYALGGAQLSGDLGGMRLSAPVVGIGGASSGGGYGLVTADGRVFPFGPAQWHGDASRLHLRAPIVGIVGGSDGYYLFAADGGVFAFGGACFFGSAAGRRLAAPIAAMGIQLDIQPAPFPPPCQRN
jgi:hypothetical protein